MSYDKFKKKVWIARIEKDLERDLILAQDTNRNYEGAVVNVGDSVKIIGAGKVTIRTNKDGKAVPLSDPEKLVETEVSMAIKTISDFNFNVDDIDQAQGAGKALDIYTQEASRGLADEIDKNIAEQAKDPLAFVHKGGEAIKITKANCLEVLDDMLLTLQKNDVKPSREKVTVYVSPEFHKFLRQRTIDIDTNNHEMLKRGAVGMYNNIDIKVSNNVCNEGGTDYIMMKTKNAIASAEPKKTVEPYRPEKGFSDAVKGFVLYDSKLVRPKEMVVLKAKYE